MVDGIKMGTAGMIALGVGVMLLAGCPEEVRDGGDSGDSGAGGAGGAGGEAAMSQTGGASGDGGNVLGTGGNGGSPSGTAGGPGLEPPKGCELEGEIEVTPSPNSPTDGCEATYLCDGGVELVVGCDGENDGTNTSLCSCHVDGDYMDGGPGGLAQGEGEEACLNAFDYCTAR